MTSSKPKMTSAQLLSARQRVIKLYKRGRTSSQIADETGLSLALVNRAIALFETGDMDALQPRTGRTEGSGRSLSQEQEDTLKNILYTKQPNEVRIISLDGKYYTAPTEDELIEEWLPYKEEMLHGDSPQYLWCRDSVKALVDQISGIVLSDQAIRNYLHRWEFPKTKKNQRPISRCSQDIQDWLQNNPKGQNGQKRYWLNRERLNTAIKQSKISATDDKRKEYWTVIQGNFSKDKQIDFLHQLKRQVGEPIIVVRYNYKHYTQEEIFASLPEKGITTIPPLLEDETRRLNRDKVRDAENQVGIINEKLKQQGSPLQCFLFVKNRIKAD